MRPGFSFLIKFVSNSGRTGSASQRSRHTSKTEALVCRVTKLTRVCADSKIECFSSGFIHLISRIKKELGQNFSCCGSVTKNKVFITIIRIRYMVINIQINLGETFAQSISHSAVIGTVDCDYLIIAINHLIRRIKRSLSHKLLQGPGMGSSLTARASLPKDKRIRVRAT